MWEKVCACSSLYRLVHKTVVNRISGWISRTTLKAVFTTNYLTPAPHNKYPILRRRQMAFLLMPSQQQVTIYSRITYNHSKIELFRWDLDPGPGDEHGSWSPEDVFSGFSNRYLSIYTKCFIVQLQCSRISFRIAEMKFDMCRVVFPISAILFLFLNPFYLKYGLTIQIRWYFWRCFMIPRYLSMTKCIDGL